MCQCGRRKPGDRGRRLRSADGAAAAYRGSERHLSRYEPWKRPSGHLHGWRRPCVLPQATRHRRGRVHVDGARVLPDDESLSPCLPDRRQWAFERNAVAQRRLFAGDEPRAGPRGAPVSQPLQVASDRLGATLRRACPYVVLNPVAAGLCERPEDWEWSSYRATAGLAERPAFLADGELLRPFAASTNEARRRYRELVDDGVAELRAARDAIVAPANFGVSHRVRSATVV